MTPAKIQSRFRFSLAPLLHWIGRRARFSIGVSIAIFIAAIGILVLHPSEILPLESDLTVMHPRPNPPLETQKLISDWFGMHDWLIVHLRADSPDNLAAQLIAWSIGSARTEREMPASRKRLPLAAPASTSRPRRGFSGTRGGTEPR